MSTAISNVSMGGAVLTAVEAVVSAGAESLSVADAGSKEAFLDAWTRTFAEHARLLHMNGDQLTAPIVMVYVPHWAEFGKKAVWKRKAMLGARPSDLLAGTLGVGRLEVGAFVCPSLLSDTDKVTEVIELEGLSDYLTIALMSTSSLWIWPDGINAETEPYRHDIGNSEVVKNLDHLDSELKRFYEHSARQTKKWWLDRGKRIAVDKTESVVQNDLLQFLIGAYSERAKVREEITSGNGRMDITLVPFNHMDSSAVLELKVTKDFATPREETKTPTGRSLNENIDWAISGVAQTAAYRDHEKLSGAFLCVYDFCSGNLNSIEEAIKNAAMPHNVYGRRYWITVSHEEHRMERYPLAVTSPSSVA